MLLKPTSFKRGDSLENVEHNLVAGIGAFSEACVNSKKLAQPLEVILLEGNAIDGFHARLGDEHHHVHEGKLSHAQVSFTLEAFSMKQNGDPLPLIQKDSACLKSAVTSELRAHILNLTHKHGIHGALLHITGVAKSLSTYGHNNAHKLSNDTKTFDHQKNPVMIEGWGNFSLIDGKTPFVHMHGVYVTAEKKRLGGHYIMDEETLLPVDTAELTVYPIPSLIRSVQKEDFPTWKL